MACAIQVASLRRSLSPTSSSARGSRTSATNTTAAPMAMPARTSHSYQPLIMRASIARASAGWPAGSLGYPPPVPLALIDYIPPSGIQLGPLTLGFYGIGYVLAVAVMLLVSRSEARRKGMDPALVMNALIVVAIFALVGARLYHIVDQLDRYAADPLSAVLPPYSGLGLFGGIFGAAIGIWIFVRGKDIPLGRALDVVVPGTLLAQGIARWGNFANQELYGPPTDFPWGIAIDCAHRVAQYPCSAFPVESTGFHPLFFYESVLTIAGGVIALVVARRFADRLLDGDLASFWMVWYGGVRLLLESFREGWNWTVLGVPTAMLIGVALILAGLGTAWWRHSRGRRRREGGVASSGELGRT
jgi:phosphatidylglycerol:prolipoprotein diacylglycerol transferase